MEKYNSKTLVYPDGQKNTVFANKSIFSSPVQKNRRKTLKERLPPKPVRGEKVYRLSYRFQGVFQVVRLRHIARPKPIASESSKARALKRAHDRLFDLVYCNDFQWFLSITFNPGKVDSYDVKAVMKKVTKWLGHLVTRRGLRYVLVPEYHKSGRIHCHLLANDGVFRLVDSGKLTMAADGEHHPIYNVQDWQYGFSTAIRIYGEPCAAACYLTKYITKQNDMIFGRYYWSSRNLVRTPEVLLYDTAYQQLDLPEVPVPQTGLRLKYFNEMRMRKDDFECSDSAFSG